MALFPSSPTNGQTTVVNGITYTYNSAQTAWIRTSAAPSGDLNVSGNLTATGNISGVRLISNVATGTAPLTVSSTTVVANLNADLLDGFNSATANTASTVAVRDASGNLAANFFIGNGSQLTGINASTSSITNGNSNVNIPTANGNVNISAVGNANILVVTGTGANIAGTLNVTGNANAGNIGATNGVFTNVSGNGSVLSSITGANVTGAVSFATTANAVAGANVSGTVASATAAINASALLQNTSTATTVYPTFTTSSANGNSSAVINTGISANLANNSITATTFVGALSGNATTAGTVVTAAQGNITSVGTLTSLGVSGTVTAPAFTANTGVFTGNGNGLSSITGANVTGAVSFATTANAVAGANVSGAVSFATTANAVAGANVSGTVSSATTAGTVTTAAQPNITSTGTLSSLTVTSNVAAGNLTTTGVLSVTGTGVSSIAGNLDMTSNTIINLASPTNSTDAATKQYVDDIAQGLHTHDSCNAATQTTLASISGGTVTYNNGASGVGANLTTTGTFSTIDGVPLSNGMRILVKNEANTAHNGIYDRTSTTVLTRSTDFDTPTEMAGGDFTFVSAGTLYDNTGWVMPDPVTTVGTSPVVWVQFSGAGTYTAGTGLTLTGSQFSVNVAQSQITSVGTLTGLNSSGTITAPAFTANTGIFTGNGSGLSAIAGGNVTGTVANATAATNASAVLQNASTNTMVYPLFTTNSSDGNANTVFNTNIRANLSNNSITATTFVGSLSGAALTASVVTASSQPNITSVGSLTDLGVNGNVNVGNLGTVGIISAFGNISTQGQLISTTGVSAPLVVSSTTKVANLNADLLDGFDTSSANVANTVVVRDSSGSFDANVVNAATLLGDGGNISNIQGGNVSGTVSSATTAGTVTTNAQSNITSLGTLTSLDVSGTVTAPAFTANTGVFTGNGNGLSSIVGANVTGAVAFATTANAVAGANVSGAVSSATTAGTVTTAAQPNITSVGTLTSLGVTGTTTSGNFATAGNITASFLVSNVATGTAPLTVTSTTRVGNLNVAQANVADFISVAAGTGNNFIIFANAATGNVSELTSTGLIANLSNNSITATTFVGALSGAATTAGTVTTAAQGNITSLGTLTSLTVSGTSNLNNVSNVTILGGSLNQVLTTNGSGGLSWTTVSGGGGASIANGTSNVNIPSASGNVNISAVGNANVVVVTGTGANVNGTLTATGNVVLSGANVSLGAVGNLKITGGTANQFLRSDGAGAVSWQTLPVTNIQEFTATASQTTFTVTGTYIIGSVLVFVNGIQLNSGDYTASTGTTVVLTDPRAAGDIVRVISGIGPVGLNNIQTFSVAMSVALGM